MKTAIDIRASINSIKAELGKGEVVTRGRQTGKTTALLEFVHENNPGEVILVVGGLNIKEWTKHRYRETFPNDPQPTVISVHNVNDSDVRGTTRKWATDEVWPRSVVNRARDYEYVDYLGGVGSPMCMDDFSGVFLTGAEEEVPESPKPVFMQVSYGKRKRK